MFACSRLFAFGDSESEREPQPSEVCCCCENRGWGDIQVLTEATMLPYRAPLVSATSAVELTLFPDLASMQHVPHEKAQNR